MTENLAYLTDSFDITEIPIDGKIDFRPIFNKDETIIYYIRGKFGEGYFLHAHDLITNKEIFNSYLPG